MNTHSFTYVHELVPSSACLSSNDPISDGPVRNFVFKLISIAISLLSITFIFAHKHLYSKIHSFFPSSYFSLQSVSQFNKWTLQRQMTIVHLVCINVLNKAFIVLLWLIYSAFNLISQVFRLLKQVLNE